MNQKRKTETPQIPAFRFSGFSGEWTVGNLGKYAQIGTGTRDVQEATENGVYPFFIRSEEVKRINSYSFDGEAILIPGEGRLGEIFHYINGKFDYHQRVYKISDFKGLYGKFVLHYMRTHFKRHAMKYTVKATVDSLRLPTIKEFLIYYPAYAEQTQIGEFFQTIDRLIELQSEKVAQAERYKKAMLQKLFPQKGETIPKLRFAGFSGEWEKVALGNITNLITKGTTPKDKTGEGSVNFIKIENINPNTGKLNLTSKIPVSEHNSNLKRSQLMEGDILFSIAGTLGRIGIITEEMLPANTNQALAIIRLSSGVLNYIKVALITDTVKSYIRKSPTVGAQPNLSLQQISKLEIFFPSLEEQTQIGNFFQILDKRIEAEGQKLERYQTLKRAMLQRMFV